MAINKTTKSTLNVVIPVIAAGIAAYVAWRGSKNWIVTLVATVLGFVLVWAITARLTKTAYLAGPADVPTGGGCEGYDPKPLIDGIYDNTTCILCLGDEDLYKALLALPSCQLRKCYNYWNEMYYPKKQKSLPIWLNEKGPFSITYNFSTKPALMQKISAEGLQ